MQGDSDDEINELRTVALLSKPTNMRKRKVTLTNKRKVFAGANGGDKREVVRTRQVVVGAKSRSPSRAITLERTVDNGADTDPTVSPGAEKKARLEKDERIFSVAEEKESTSILDEKDAKGSGWQSGTGDAKGSGWKSGTGQDGSAVTLKADIRIVLKKIETMDSRSSGEPSVEVAAGDNAEEEHLDDEVDKVDLEIEKENDGISDDEGGEEEEEEDIASDEHAEPVALGEEQQEQEVLQTDEIADTIGGDTIEKEGKDAREKDGQDNDLKNDEKQLSNASKSTEKVMEKDTSDNEQLNVENEAETKNKDDPLVNGNTPPDISEQKDINSNKADQDATSAAGSDNKSSGSDSSFSSSSSGSSSSSSGSSSSGNSSDSGSTSSSDSGSDSDNEHSPARKSKSRSVSVSSSSYSYSTGGSTEKKATLRSVVSQTNRTSPQRGRVSRSPNMRRTSRDRRYTGRPRSLEDRKRGEIDSERSRRGDEYWHSRRRSPYRRRETGDSRSSQRYYRRGSRDRSRSRERERPRLQARMRTRSKSRERNDGLPCDPMESKNPLLRKDDDYVEINVEKEQNIRPLETPKVGRLVEKKTDDEGTELSFDLRSRLGPKKNKNENAEKQSEKKSLGREKQHVRKKAVGVQLNTSVGDTVEKKSDKELILDARIERIRVQNEEIKKRQEEIEREKLLFG